MFGTMLEMARDTVLVRESNAVLVGILTLYLSWRAQRNGTTERKLAPVFVFLSVPPFPCAIYHQSNAQIPSWHVGRKQKRGTAGRLTSFEKPVKITTVRWGEGVNKGRAQIHNPTSTRDNRRVVDIADTVTHMAAIRSG